jgi:FkbM family methyltransferase
MRTIRIDGVNVYLDSPSISSEMYAALVSGRFERAERAAAAQFIEAGHRVLEIGTCTGLVAMTIARIVGADRIFCYEANPAAVALAKQNFELNEMNIAITECILLNRVRYSENKESFNFFLSDQLVSGSLQPRRGRTAIPVAVRCLEDELETTAATVLVCDIEGGEVELLQDANLINVELIIMEEHSRKVGEAKINHLLESLHNKGFMLLENGRLGDVLCLARPKKVRMC